MSNPCAGAAPVICAMLGGMTMLWLNDTIGFWPSMGVALLVLFLMAGFVYAIMKGYIK